MPLLGNVAARVWLVLFLLYGAFFSWYTSFDGPLSSEEIAHFRPVLEEMTEGDPERIAAWMHFMQTDTGDDFAMISVVDMREMPTVIEGVEEGESSESVLAKYAEPFFGQVVRSGAHPVLAGSAASPPIDIWGIEGANEWDDAAVVRWRSRRDLVKFAERLRNETRDGNIHHFKIAAIEKTIAYPLDPWASLGDLRIVLALGFAVIGLSAQAFSRRA